eukprot:CAMPEP_0184862994 /NCGR_PEP_ID=MMETSP0580-20130426/8191_1 /TAXON_ID=1118495 /ORGANISM="Dactyliosolen fragilissimus" /LENGTH=447 /DNA_ID=CAMNT_0027361023 /DNA_START=59 /DNA_END=1402 /DNA_ORIENTATION=+
MSTKQRVSYFYHPEVGHFYYGPSHPMKPHRLKLAHHLILSYGLYKKMECYRPHPASPGEMSEFHSEDYVNFLSRITPDNLRQFSTQMQKFNAGEYTDCPVFDGLFEFTQLYSGASIDGAIKLNNDETDIAINWSGGLHHAKKSEASGFCYINDIVLAILELLKVHARVLYIDIDVHHGDGVEEAFYCTDRVMTFSLHKYGDFFPGTGHIKDVGAREGAGFSVNAPLSGGMTDDAYERIFKPVLDKIMAIYRPGAIVLQCGADSLTGDRLGCFNLSLKGHAECVKYVKSFHVPTLVLGGGGYTIRNVARCWAYETAVLLEEEVPNEIPHNDYFEYYAPDFGLHLVPEPRENQNSNASLEAVKNELLEQLNELKGAPGVQMQEIPPAFNRITGTNDDDNDGGVEGKNDGGSDDDIRDKSNGKTRKGDGEKHAHPAEFYDGDNDNSDVPM